MSNYHFRRAFDLLLVLCVFRAAAQEGKSSSPRGDSWTNAFVVKSSAAFPIEAALRDSGLSSSSATNAATFSLLADGTLHLTLPALGATPQATPTMLRLHIDQAVFLAKQLEMYKRHSSAMVSRGAFPTTLPLGQVAPSRDHADQGQYFRLTLFVSTNGRPLLFLESESSSKRGLEGPLAYDLSILDNYEAGRLLRLLEEMPDYTWWREKSTAK